MRATITILIVIVTETLSQVCNHENSVKLNNRTYNGIYYKHNEYYVDASTGLERGCVCLKELCARKCCPFGQGYDQSNKKCVNIQDVFNPPVWDGSKLITGFNVSKEFHFLFYKMNCSSDLGEVRIPVGSAVLEFHLITNGHLYVKIDEGTSQIYGPDKYCIDNFVTDVDNTVLNALICFTSEPETNNYKLSSTFMLISCFFMILTLLVYAWLPDLRNLHGMVLMAYLSAFFVGLLFLALMQILLLWGNITSEMCVSFTFIIYFSLLAAFFWLNIMCYDIWWTFSGKRSVSSRPSSIKGRFINYSVYAFGMPTLLTILLAILEFCVSPNKSTFLPGIRTQGCFIYGKSKFIYLYVPMTVLCVANLIFFILTAIKIAEIKNTTRILQNKQDKQRFTLYIKLFIIMGVNWILEVVSSFYPDATIVWKFTDAYNVLVGLIIFIIFVCKKKIWIKIKERIKDCSWSNTGMEEMKNISRDMNSKKLNRWHNRTEIRASIDTVKTTLETDIDSKSIKSVRSTHLLQ